MAIVLYSYGVTATDLSLPEKVHAEVGAYRKSRPLREPYFKPWRESYLVVHELAQHVVLPRLVKRPYKIYFWNIPYFMRVRKRFDAKKIRKIG